jgi:ribosomal protein S18 acetylase RimI-like enzyme
MSSSDPISIRQASLQDAAALADLIEAFTNNKSSVSYTVTSDVAAERLTSLESLQSVFVAELASEVVGFVGLRVSPSLDQEVPYAEVTELYVRPKARRRGIALALMAEAEKAAVAAGATSVHLIAHREDHEAISFYDRAGYEPLYLGLEKILAVQEMETARYG